MENMIKEKDREVGVGQITEDLPTMLKYSEEGPLVSFESRSDIDCLMFWRIVVTFVKRL